MARTILSNAFSLNMLSTLMPSAGYSHTLTVDSVDVERVRKSIKNGFESFIGHNDLANIVSGMLDIEVVPNRGSVSLLPGDLLIVAQYIGPRLEEGTVALPEGAEIRFFEVKII